MSNGCICLSLTAGSILKRSCDQAIVSQLQGPHCFLYNVGHEKTALETRKNRLVYSQLPNRFGHTIYQEALVM